MPFEPRADPYHTVERCWNWYQLHREAAQRLITNINDSLRNGNPIDIDEFVGMTPMEFNTAANWQMQELEHLTAMNLFSATEAGLWRDYRRKGRGKQATPLATAMRALYAAKGSEFYDLGPVLDIWCDNTTGQERQYFAEYKGALHYRHWLAHGRHWILLGERYTLAKVLDICTNTANSIEE